MKERRVSRACYKVGWQIFWRVWWVSHGRSCIKRKWREKKWKFKRSYSWAHCISLMVFENASEKFELFKNYCFASGLLFFDCNHILRLILRGGAIIRFKLVFLIILTWFLISGITFLVWRRGYTSHIKSDQVV